MCMFAGDLNDQTMFKPLTVAEIAFAEGGPFYHVCTAPIEDDVLFRTRDDYVLINNIIAVAVFISGVRLLAFAIMDNHLHFILEGKKSDCVIFFEAVHRMLMNYYTRHGRAGSFAKMQPKYIDITSLDQLLTEIAYVIRNPFVVRTDVNLLAYPWTSGYLYFNPMADTGGEPASTLRGRRLRAFIHSRAMTEVDERIRIRDGKANPASFVDYKRVEMFFGNARDFQMHVFKNVEAQVETSKRLGEEPRLNDQEMISVSFKLCRSLFSKNHMKDLSEEQKKRLAKTLKDEFGGSNKQIARCTNLPIQVVNAMFPLSIPREEQCAPPNTFASPDRTKTP